MPSFVKREKASARASSDCYFLLVIKSQIMSNYPKSTPTHSEPPKYTSPKNSNTIPIQFLKNSQRIPEFPKNSQRMPEKFPKNFQRIPKEFPNIPKIIISWLWKCDYYQDRSYHIPQSSENIRNFAVQNEIDPTNVQKYLSSLTSLKISNQLQDQCLVHQS